MLKSAIGGHAMHQLLGCRSTAEAVRELPLRAPDRSAAGALRQGVAAAQGA